MTAMWLKAGIAQPNESEDVREEEVDAASDISLRLGGMALSNGLIVVSARHWAVAIREGDGSISVASGKKPLLPGTGERKVGKRAASCEGEDLREDSRYGKGEGIPLLRGLGRLAESMMVLGLVKKRLPGARLPFETKRVAQALVISTVGASAVRLVAPRSALVQEAGAVVAAFVPAVLSIKDSPVSGYHGAEHKVIGAREAAIRASAAAGDSSDLAVVTGDASAAPKEHERCGSNLVGPFLFASVFTNVLARDRQGHKTPLRSAVASAASLGIALEALRWADKHEASLVARVMMWPGKVIQRSLTTTEPTPEQLEVGERALGELLRLEGATG